MSHRIAALLFAAAVAAHAADAAPAPAPAPAPAAPAAAAPATAPAPAAAAAPAPAASRTPIAPITAEAVKPAVKPVAKPSDDNSKLSEEEKWVFEPVAGRVDPFYDRKSQMKLELQVKELEPDTQNGTLIFTDPNKRQDYVKAMMQKVESAIVAKKWDDAIKTCDQAIKALSKDQGNDEAQGQIEKFKRYRTQAEEAKTYEEAQAKFDALDLRIEGILWSPEGSLAVINGEPRARGVNERVKDCVIINIDTNRVDFLFHYNRRRFEFQRYVGEDAKTSAKKEDGR